MKLRSALIAAAVATSVIISGTTTALAEDTAKVSDERRASNKERVLAAIKAREDASAAEQAAAAAREEDKAHTNNQARANEVAASLSYGKAGTIFNEGIDELNAAVNNLGAPKIGEPGGPIATDKLADSPFVDGGYRPFANQADYDAFNEKLREAFQRADGAASAKVLAGLQKVNGNRAALKDAIAPYYNALNAPAEPSEKTAAAEKKAAEAKAAADGLDTAETLATFKKDALDAIPAHTEDLERVLAEKKAAQHNLGDATKAVDAAKAALGAAKEKLEALPPAGAPSVHKAAVLAAIDAVAAAEDAVAAAYKALDGTTAPQQPEQPKQPQEDKAQESGPLSFITKIWNWIRSFFGGAAGSARGLSS